MLCGAMIFDRRRFTMGSRSPAWFVGVDLAWSQRHPSGVAILTGGDEQPLRFVGAEVFGSIEEIAEQILPLKGAVWVAIDAPVVVKNAEHQRDADWLISTHYGRFEASAHSTNLSILRNEVRGAELAERLVPAGVVSPDGLRLKPRMPGSWAFETYPHAAMIELFGLEKTIKYKKGRIDSKRAGLAELTTLLRARLPLLDPPLALTPGLALLLDAPPSVMVGAALKGYEDRLDALVCAYLAAHLWYWGAERNWSLGPAGEGTVILPALRSDIDHASES
jgi:predicted RNase H-like nuclease